MGWNARSKEGGERVQAVGTKGVGGTRATGHKKKETTTFLKSGCPGLPSTHIFCSAAAVSCRKKAARFGPKTLSKQDGVPTNLGGE